MKPTRNRQSLCSCPTLAGADSAYRRSYHRGLLDLWVYLFSEAVPPTRRCGSDVLSLVK
jgi:hypothetical protein